jgi:hypothetical protein
MKKVFALFGVLLMFAGCGSAIVDNDVAVYDGGTFTFEYPSGWQISEDKDGVIVEDSDGIPLLHLSKITSSFGMEGYRLDREEDYTNSNDIKFKLHYNKIDLESIEMLEWNEGVAMYENDTTFVLISTPDDLYKSPIFYRYDKTDSAGEAGMKKILDSFKKK